MYSVKYEIEGRSKEKKFGLDETPARRFYNRIKHIADVAQLCLDGEWIEMMPPDD